LGFYVRSWLYPAVFLLIMSASLYAQTGGAASGANRDEIFSHPLEETNRQRFIALCGDLAKNPVIKGQFEQTKTINRLKRTLVSQGNFTIAPDLGMIWDTLSPFPSTMAVGKDYLVQSTPSGGKSKMDAKGNETFLRLAETISAIFTGNSRLLLNNFENYFSESGNSWTVGLIPGEKTIRSFAERIVMGGEYSANGKSAVIQSITLYEQNGDIIRYSLSNHYYPGAISADDQTLFSVR
jgi:hypothetical protein